ncbi:putative F-box protein At5g55150 [Apium graveolens]|uniref:putative F-box protein At5g55150 n=1 Tax=Apium graveolens TaxID=4045 RepID=UPI003D7B856B
MSSDNWNNLPKDLLIDIVQRLTCLEDYFTSIVVCKSWNSVALEAVASLADSVIAEKPWWLLLRSDTTTPMLLLAEEVAPGSIRYDTEFDLNRDYAYDKDGFYIDDEDHDKDTIRGYDYLKNSVGTSRGLYSLSSMKTYNIELPEAAGKLILGTSKGWLLTLGRDLQINLLHPLLRHQISLPPMNMFTAPTAYLPLAGFTEEHASEQFIRKVAMSSELPQKKTDLSSLSHHSTRSPIVMVVYHRKGVLGFARSGDKRWTDVRVCSDGFHDIVYHKGKFYAVDFQGNIYLCCIDVDEKREWPRATKIASIKTNNNQQKYLAEPLSGSGLLLVVRYDRDKLIKRNRVRASKYRTTNFEVWRLELEYCNSLRIPSCTLTPVNNLGNEAIFIGRASSLCVPSSDIIKPNSIYFTDDHHQVFIRLGGGHDMGIFDIEHRTIEPHYQGKSIHCISPPLWYI